MDVYINPAPSVERDLAELESEWPGITVGYTYLLRLLREDPRLGLPFDRSDSDLKNVRYTDIHSVGPGIAGRYAGVLIFDLSRDHAIHVQPLGIFRGSDWREWSYDERKEAITRLL
jgi:hypothetical protein